MRILVKQIGALKAPNFMAIADAVYDFATVKAETRLLQHGKKFVSSWNNPPSFRAKTEIEGQTLIVSVEPTGNEDAVNHWKWVSRGTGNLGVKSKGSGYTIYPSSGLKALHYIHTYVPKTSGKGQYVKTGGPGAYTGGEVYASSEEHFGIKPRHFEEAWRVYANLWWGPGIRDAVAKATKSL